MKIIAEIPDDHAEAVSILIRYLELLDPFEPGDLVLATLRGLSVEHQLQVPLLSLQVAPARKKTAVRCADCGEICGTRENPKETWSGQGRQRTYYCKRTCSRRRGPRRGSRLPPGLPAVNSVR